jgi:hypothetical protein
MAACKLAKFIVRFEPGQRDSFLTLRRYMFRVGDIVRVIDSGNNNVTPGDVGQVYKVDGDIYWINFPTQPAGLFSHRLELVKAAHPKDVKQAEAQKNKDEALAKVEDVLDLVKKKILNRLATELDKATAKR